jgi:hypothetical protein
MARYKLPSDRQLKAIALKAANPQMSKREAVLQAGFSPATAHNATKNVFSKPLIQTWIENYRHTIERAGLTQERVAGKLNELLDASFDLRDKKTGAVIASVPNQKLQLETVKVYNEIFDVKGTESKPKEGLKRRVTLEEFEEGEVLQG